MITRASSSVIGQPFPFRIRVTVNAPSRFPALFSLIRSIPPSLPVRRGDVLEDLRGVRVRDPVRLLSLHLLDDRHPPLLGLGAGGGPVEAVADAALLFEEGFPLLHGGYRGDRRRRDGRL